MTKTIKVKHKAKEVFPHGPVLVPDVPNQSLDSYCDGYFRGRTEAFQDVIELINKLFYYSGNSVIVSVDQVIVLKKMLEKMKNEKEMH